MSATFSGSSVDVLPPICLEYEFDMWPFLTYCTFNGGCRTTRLVEREISVKSSEVQHDVFSF